jgi:hypothetical protein
MKTSHLAATATAAMLINAAVAQASTFQFPDLQRVEALRAKLHTATVDVSQVMERASAMKNYDDLRCLTILHEEAQFAEMLAAGIGDFMSLSILMKDSEDETRTLSGMQPWVTRLSGQLPHSSEIINATMSVCSNSATVNVKGQNLLKRSGRGHLEEHRSSLETRSLKLTARGIIIALQAPSSSSASVLGGRSSDAIGLHGFSREGDAVRHTAFDRSIHRTKK